MISFFVPKKKLELFVKTFRHKKIHIHNSICVKWHHKKVVDKIFAFFFNFCLMMPHLKKKEMGHISLLKTEEKKIVLKKGLCFFLLKLKHTIFILFSYVILYFYHHETIHIPIQPKCVIVAWDILTFHHRIIGTTCQP